MWLHRFLRRWRVRHPTRYPLIFQVEPVGPTELDAAESSGAQPDGHSQTHDFPPGSIREFLLDDQSLDL